jgi:hypothetical protein
MIAQSVGHDKLERVMMRAWERLPKESAPAYEAFSTYAEMGVTRSLAAVGRRLGKSRPLMERWSVRYGWVSRAAAFDQHMYEVKARARHAAEIAEAQKWARRRADLLEEEFEIGQKLTEKARQMLQMPLIEVKRELVIERYDDGRERVVQLNVLKPVRFSMSDPGRMLLLADKLVRLSLGIPTTLTGEGWLEELPPAPREQLTDEELHAIARGES